MAYKLVNRVTGQGDADEGTSRGGTVCDGNKSTFCFVMDQAQLLLSVSPGVSLVSAGESASIGGQHGPRCQPDVDPGVSVNLGCDVSRCHGRQTCQLAAGQPDSAYQPVTACWAVPNSLYRLCVSQLCHFIESLLCSRKHLLLLLLL